MPVKIDLLPTPRFQEGFLNWANQNFIRISNAVLNAAKVSTGTTEPSDPGLGDIFTNTARETMEVYSGTDFQVVGSYNSRDYSPNITQLAAVTRTLTHGKYQLQGDWCTGEVFCTFTGAGTAGNPIIVGIPVPIQSAQGQTVAWGRFTDASVPTVHRVFGVVVSGQIYLETCQVNSAAFFGADAASFNGAIASGDDLSINFRYRYDN